MLDFLEIKRDNTEITLLTNDEKESSLVENLLSQVPTLRVENILEFHVGSIQNVDLWNGKLDTSLFVVDG